MGYKILTIVQLDTFTSIANYIKRFSDLSSLTVEVLPKDRRNAVPGVGKRARPTTRSVAN